MVYKYHLESAGPPQLIYDLEQFPPKASTGAGPPHQALLQLKTPPELTNLSEEYTKWLQTPFQDSSQCEHVFKLKLRYNALKRNQLACLPETNFRSWRPPLSADQYFRLTIVVKVNYRKLGQLQAAIYDIRELIDNPRFDTKHLNIYFENGDAQRSSERGDARSRSPERHAMKKMHDMCVELMEKKTFFCDLETMSVSLGPSWDGYLHRGIAPEWQTQWKKETK